MTPPRKYPLPSIGDRFGEWTVIGKPYTDGPSKRSHVHCRCACGNERAIPVGNLVQHLSSNCGCKRASQVASRNRTHGLSDSPLYRIWAGIKDRCLRERNASFPNYGGRGITVCDAWRDDFVAFREWAVANGYEPALEIDRVDNDGDYEPTNCRWVTRSQNQRNTRRNPRIAAFGESKGIQEWGVDARCVVTPKVLQERLITGWPPALAITEPVWPGKHLKHRHLSVE